MNPPSKPRSNSPLRMLPEERQAEIITRLKAGSLEDARQWLAQDGFKTSTGALSEFWSWWHLRQQRRQDQSDTETLLEELAKDNPTLSEKKLFSYGQRIFSTLALKNQDPKDWARIQMLRLNDQRTDLEARRIAVLEKKAAAFDKLKEASSATGGITADTLKKIEAELKLL